MPAEHEICYCFDPNCNGEVDSAGLCINCGKWQPRPIVGDDGELQYQMPDGTVRFAGGITFTAPVSEEDKKKRSERLLRIVEEKENRHIEQDPIGVDELDALDETNQHSVRTRLHRVVERQQIEELRSKFEALKVSVNESVNSVARQISFDEDRYDYLMHRIDELSDRISAIETLTAAIKDLDERTAWMKNPKTDEPYPSVFDKVDEGLIQRFSNLEMD